MVRVGLRILRSIEVQYIQLESGKLGVVEFTNQLPFVPKRFYYLSNVPELESRGSHAHKELVQAFFALSGSFELEVHNGDFSESVAISDVKEGYLVPRGVWRQLKKFTPGSICLVIASEKYDAADYIKDFDEFLEWKNHGNR